MRLWERYGDARVETACARALEFDVIDVPRIARMLKLALEGEQQASEAGKLRALPSARAPRFVCDAARLVTQREGQR